MARARLRAKQLRHPSPPAKHPPHPRLPARFHARRQRSEARAGNLRLRTGETALRRILWRSTLVATGHTPDANGNFPQHDKTRAKFVDAFPELFPVEFNANLKQALFLTNNPLLDELLRPKDGNLTEKLLALATPRDRVQAAFAAILGRAPDTEELTRATAYLTTRAKNPEVATRELVWSLLTGAEFRFNH